MAGNILLKQGTHTQTQAGTSSAVNSGAVSAANGTANLGNSTALDEQVSAVLNAGFTSAPTEGNSIDLYLVPKLDGTNVADVDTAGTLPFQYRVGSFLVAKNQTAAQRMAIDGIPVTAYDYAPYLVNNSGQQVSAGWTLDFYGTQHQYT